MPTSFIKQSTLECDLHTTDNIVRGIVGTGLNWIKAGSVFKYGIYCRNEVLCFPYGHFLLTVSKKCIIRSRLYIISAMAYYATTFLVGRIECTIVRRMSQCTSN